MKANKFDLRAAAAAMGKRGGKSTSEAKRAASRDNGKRGGRPKGSKTMYTVIQSSGWQGSSWKVAQTFDSRGEAEQFKSANEQSNPKHDFYNVRVMQHSKSIASMTDYDTSTVKFNDGTVAAVDW